jgi:hypothetical protein
MSIDVSEYIKNLDYSHKNTDLNELLCLLPSLIILREKESVLSLTPLEIKHEKSFITQIRFFVQVTDSLGTRVVKNVHVVAQGDSKERIVKIETLFSETPFDCTCLVTLTIISSKFKIVEKKIELQDSIDVSGKLLSYLNQKPRSNTTILVAIHQKQRHEIHSHVQEIKTSEKGYFKTKFAKNELLWKDTAFWLSFHNKIAEEVSIEYDYLNSHCCEKVALIAAIFFDSLSP